MTEITIRVNKQGLHAPIHSAENLVENLVYNFTQYKTQGIQEARENLEETLAMLQTKAEKEEFFEVINVKNPFSMVPEELAAHLIEGDTVLAQLSGFAEIKGADEPAYLEVAKEVINLLQNHDVFTYHGYSEQQAEIKELITQLKAKHLSSELG